MSGLYLAAVLVLIALLLPFGSVLVGAAAGLPAFLVGGTSLRPRGSRLRGLVLGAAVYLLLGTVAMSLVHALVGSSVVREAGSSPLLVLFEVALWPVFVAIYFYGTYA